MQAQQERASGSRRVVDDIHRVVAEQFGEIASLVDLHVVLVQARVPVVVGSAGAKAIEVVVSTLQRTVFRQQPEMPLAYQRGAVARLL